MIVRLDLQCLDHLISTGYGIYTLMGVREREPPSTLGLLWLLLPYCLVNQIWTYRNPPYDKI